jgi:hypothetical protein
MLKDSIQRLKDLVASVDDDLAKTLSGQKAAAVRLRKTMMEVQWAARQVREDALRHGPTVQDVASEGKAAQEGDD